MSPLISTAIVKPSRAQSIARQLGHSTTEMLFRVYSRFVPNLTRRDGAAFEALMQLEGVKLGVPRRLEIFSPVERLS